MENKFVPGRLVCSTAGRDSRKFYLVINMVNDTIAQVADGEVRKLKTPKKKNIKHLKVYPQLATEITEKSHSGQRVTDLDIRNGLQRLMAETLAGTSTATKSK